MNNFKALFFNKIILSSVAAVVVIAVASVFYYSASTHVPQNSLTDANATTTTQAVTGSGTVEPAENPNLAFESAGRVASVRVSVGQHVYQGQLLASLDTAALSAQRAQAQAALVAQQAKLDSMKAGARPVDVTAKQTAVAQANIALSNLYASVPQNIAQAYDKSFSGTSANTDILFGQPNSPSPTLIFSTNNSQLATNAINQRTLSNSELAMWSTQSSALSSASTPVQIDTALTVSLAHLQILRTYTDSLLLALGAAVPTSGFSQASISAAQTSVGTLRDTINSSIMTLQGQQQQISTDELAVQSAQDALNQTLAGSTPQDIEAQQAQVDAAAANVQNVDAQIQNAEVVAPFAGTVASVHIKQGDIVAPNTSAVSLNPESALQVDSYFSETDVTKIKAGNSASVTLDAYGQGREFSASVVSVDQSPSPVTSGQRGGSAAAATGYKVTLQFAQSDPAVSSGMTANVSIPLNQ